MLGSTGVVIGEHFSGLLFLDCTLLTLTNIFLDTTIDIDGDEVELFDKSDSPEYLKEDENDSTSLIDNKPQHSLWSFAYYQEFFDVDTATVVKRIKRSFIPLPFNLARTHITKKPDMYGPFWICATLVLCIAVFGNLSTLVNNLQNENYKYKPQFQLLPIAAVIIYCYTFVLPLLIKGYFWWFKSDFKLAVSQIICLYGYSMFIFIPSSVMFIVPYAVFNWFVVAVTAALSGSVIVISLLSAFQYESRKSKIIFVVILFAVHVATIVALKWYFFNTGFKNTNSSSSDSVIINVPKHEDATIAHS